MKFRQLILLLLILGRMPAQEKTAASTNSCITCHSALDGALAGPTQLIKDGVHTKNGFSCSSCHGGNPSSSDMSDAMNPGNGFLGKPDRKKIPELCGRCHSDAAFMHKFRPQQRVDQLELYKTSIHGKRLAKGDTAVAVCTDCHSVHERSRHPRGQRCPVAGLSLEAARNLQPVPLGCGTHGPVPHPYGSVCEIPEECPL
jgi:hypothetical protein